MPQLVDTPSLSIIVAVYNAIHTIGRCIESVTAQTYPYRELIVIDGGSTDGTVEILRQKSDQIQYWVSEPDTGICNAWNKGVQKARGEWIGFLGADDFLWSGTALAHMARALCVVFPRVRVVYGRVAFVSERGDILETLGRPWEEMRSVFRSLMVVPHPGMLCHRTVFEKHGFFDEKFRIAGDYEFLLRELKDRDAYFADGPIVVGMQAGGLCSQAGLALRILRETGRAQTKHSLRPNSWTRTWAYSKAYALVAASGVLGERLTSIVVGRLRRLRAGLRRLVTGNTV